MIRCNIYQDEMKKVLFGTIQDISMPIIRFEKISPTVINEKLRSWKISGVYTGKSLPQNLQFYWIKIATPFGYCYGKAFWQSFYPDETQQSRSKCRGIAEFVGTDKLEGPLKAIEMLQSGL